MINIDAIKEEAITHLQNLLRINTTNPPGNEMQAVIYLSDVLKKENIEHKIFETAPGRGCLVARINGNGSQKPLLLNGHLDVVPCEKEHWQHDPFSGIIDEGCVWGRGAIDMKNMVASSLMLLLEIKRQKINLNRDVIFAAVADEEEGCDHGSRWLVEHKPDLIQAEYALNEGGGFSLFIDKNVFYPIGVAEKGLCWFKIVAHGDPGHGSMPHQNMALVKLAQATSRLGANQFPIHKHPLVSGFINRIASKQNFLNKLILKAVLQPSLTRFILDKIFPDAKKARQFHVLLHNTASPTIMKAGSKVNVIPSDAEVHVDGRVIPGQTIETFLQEVRQIIGRDFDFEVSHSWDPVETDYANPFYDLLCNSIKQNDPQALPLPYLVPGFTDSAYYSRLGIKCYGFAPVKLPKELNFADLFHGHNERIPIAGYLWGIKVLGDVLVKA